jgi:hypothetical protein
MNRPRHRSARGALCLYLGIAAAAPTFAQFRPDQPPVLAPPTQTSPDDGTAIMESFRQKYATAHNPRIALFWNRELTDHLARQILQTSATTSNKSESSTATGDATSKSTDKREQAVTSTTNSQASLDDNQRESLDPRTDALLRTAFLETMRQAGVRFIERSLMVRNAAAGEKAPIDDQLNEMKALQQQADWLMQIVLVRDAHAPLGFSYRIAVEDIKSQALITELFTPAAPPPHAPGPYVAVNGGAGFVRAAPPPLTVREVGFTLALQIMNQLTGTL